MNFKVDVLKDSTRKIKYCTFCLGTGKLKAMQSVATYNAESVRGKDKQVKCRFCNGTGLTN